MTREEILVKAAGKLRQNAEALKQSHTLADGEWFIGDEADALARNDHDETLELAAGLLAMAKAA